ncbi:hypothetical protein Tco_0412926 [Tanacetum coccineum]
MSFLSTGVPVGPVFLLGLLALAIVAACASRAEEMPSVMSCWMVAKVMAGVSDVDMHPKDPPDLFGDDLFSSMKLFKMEIPFIFSLLLLLIYPICNKRDLLIEESDGRQVRFLGGNSSSGTKKYRGSNSSDGGNTGDGVKIAGGVIGSGGNYSNSP